MEKIDNKRKCEAEGCNNLARVNKVIDHKVYRGKLCEKHHRGKYAEKCWKWKGFFIKCAVCGWDGPCDSHRIEEQGRYIKDNVVSICPNCHRLYHRKLIEIVFNGNKVVSVSKLNPLEITETFSNSKGWVIRSI